MLHGCSEFSKIGFSAVDGPVTRMLITCDLILPAALQRFAQLTVIIVALQEAEEHYFAPGCSFVFVACD